MKEGINRSLFHFTAKADVLKKILKQGFRITYCKEVFSNELIVGIPMISFCDLPLSRTSNHTSDYGKYAIGLSKDFLLKDEYSATLNPVSYYNSPSLYQAIISLHIIRLNGQAITEQEIEKGIKNNSIKKSQDKDKEVLSFTSENMNVGIKLAFDNPKLARKANTILGFTKRYQSESKDNQIHTNYDEREWRYLIEEGGILDGKPCKWLWGLEQYDEWRGKSKKPFFNTVIPFSADSVNHIIVPKESDIPKIAEFIWDAKKIGNSPITDVQKRLLLTRIISFERIKCDI